VAKGQFYCLSVRQSLPLAVSNRSANQRRVHRR